MKYMYVLMVYNYPRAVHSSLKKAKKAGHEFCNGEPMWEGENEDGENEEGYAFTVDKYILDPSIESLVDDASTVDSYSYEGIVDRSKWES